MNIDELTIGELKEIAKLACGIVPTSGVGKRLPMPIGTKVFVRTVTHHYTGRVTAVSDEEVELSDAAWIADDGRFTQSLAEAKLDEIEVYPNPVVLNRGSFIDWTRWAHDLPRSQK